MEIKKFNSDIIYEVDKENDRVTAIIPNCRKDFMNLLHKRVSKNGNFIEILNNEVVMKIVYPIIERNISKNYRASAIRYGNDEWNEDYGMDLARTKAIIKRNSAFNKCFEEIRMFFNNFSLCFKTSDSNIIKNYSNYSKMCCTGCNMKEIHKIRDNQTTKNGVAHHCEVCGKDELCDHDDYYSELTWGLFKNSEGKFVEVCEECYAKHSN